MNVFVKKNLNANASMTKIIGGKINEKESSFYMCS